MRGWLWLCVLGLAGCGFHSQPQAQFNPKYPAVHLECHSVRTPFCIKVHNALIASGYHLQLDAPLQLHLQSLEFTQTVSPLGATIKRQYYDAYAKLNFTLQPPKKPGAIEKIEAQRLNIINANQIEGSQREYQQLQVDLQHDLLELLLIRLAHYENNTRTDQQRV